MKQDYEVKFQQFLSENEEETSILPFEELKRILMDYDGNEMIVEKYLESLKFDLSKNMEEYSSWEIEDFIEDFENYKADKTSL